MTSRRLFAATWPPALAALLLLGGLQLFVGLSQTSSIILPAPSAVLDSLVSHAAEILSAIVTTAIEASVGLAIGTVVAVLLSIVFTFWSPLRAVVFPLALVVQAIPLVALAPLASLWLGQGVLANGVLVAFIVNAIILVNMLRGLLSVDAETMVLMHSLHGSRLQTLRIVRLPAALPYLFTGLKLAVAVSLVGAIAAEYLTSLDGLGHLLRTAKTDFDSELLWATTLAASAVGLAAFGIVAAIERPVMARVRPHA